MLKTTEALIKAALRADQTTSPTERNKIMAAIRKPNLIDIIPIAPLPHSSPYILTRKDLAQKLGRSMRTIDKLAADGVIQRMVLPGRKRAFGFSVANVEKALATFEQIKPASPNANDAHSIRQ